MKILEEEIIPQFGTPEMLLADNGAQFIAKALARECEFCSSYANPLTTRQHGGMAQLSFRNIKRQQQPQRNNDVGQQKRLMKSMFVVQYQNFQVSCLTALRFCWSATLHL